MVIQIALKKPSPWRLHRWLGLLFLFLWVWSQIIGLGPSLNAYLANYINNPNGLSAQSKQKKSKAEQQETKKETKLRFDWLNLPGEPTMELTKIYQQHQSNCSIPLGDFRFRTQYGLGSDLHIWGWGLCNGLATGVRIRTVMEWAWLSLDDCVDDKANNQFHRTAPLSCYFQKVENQCPGDLEYMQRYSTFVTGPTQLSGANGNIGERCHKPNFYTDNNLTTPAPIVDLLTKQYSLPERRLAALEFLFRDLSPLIVKEAERQFDLVFPNMTQVPKDLITVHIRWGDKKREMRIVDAKEYVQAVKRILAQRGDNNEVANIYLATEDPEAVQAFQKEMPKTWNVFLDQMYTEMLPHRVDGYNGHNKAARNLNGKPGLLALGSLLVAMEANDFVLTTASNWSRLMNELRQTIVEPTCQQRQENKCKTTMIDLRPSRRGDD